jgi:copper homeostasis protein
VAKVRWLFSAAKAGHAGTLDPLATGILPIALGEATKAVPQDYGEAIEALVRCGVDRVLTSGQRDTALEGIDILKHSQAIAAGRIVIMACGALDAGNIGLVRRATGVDEMHFAALHTVPSGMVFRNPHVGMGGTALEREYEITLTDVEAVRKTIAAARAAA